MTGFECIRVGVFKSFEEAREDFLCHFPNATLAPNTDLFTPFTARNYGVEYTLEGQTHIRKGEDFLC